MTEAVCHIGRVKRGTAADKNRKCSVDTDCLIYKASVREPWSSMGAMNWDTPISELSDYFTLMFTWFLMCMTVAKRAASDKHVVLCSGMSESKKN